MKVTTSKLIWFLIVTVVYATAAFLVSRLSIFSERISLEIRIMVCSIIAIISATSHFLKSPIKIGKLILLFFLTMGAFVGVFFFSYFGRSPLNISLDTRILGSLVIGFIFVFILYLDPIIKKIKRRKDILSMPKVETPNDFVVRIEGMTGEEIQKTVKNALKELTEAGPVRPRLWKQSLSEYNITFPYGITFADYFHFLMHLSGYLNVGKSFKITGWGLVTAGNEGLLDKLINRNVMIFIHRLGTGKDQEDDHVSIITEDGEGYIIGEDNIDEPLTNPIKKYTSPPVIDQTKMLKNQIEDFQ